MFHGQSLLKSRLIVFATFAAMGAISTGCSGASSNYTVQDSGSTLSTSTLSTTTTTTTTTTSSSTGSASPYVFTVRGVGYDSTTVSVSAGQVLKVEFAPGVQDTAISGTGVYPQYSQLGVYIEVGSLTQPTEMLQNGYNGTTAQTSTVLDFSSALTACTGSTACRAPVTITITKPNNDFYCLNYGYYCPWTNVLSGQPWNGTLTVQTDDTTAI